MKEAGRKDPRNRIVLEMWGLPENVAVDRFCVASFASQLNFGLGEVEEIKVAVSEAVSNAVIHAYQGAPGPVKVSAEIRGDVLEVEVEDLGRGIEDVALARQPSFSTDPERMGLGFVFMESFMDRVEVDSTPGGGTRIRMVKRSPEGAEVSV